MLGSSLDSGMVMDGRLYMFFHVLQAAYGTLIPWSVTRKKDIARVGCR